MTKISNPIPVSVGVLTSMAPQKAFIIQPSDKLLDKVFSLHSVMVSDSERSTDLTEEGEDNNFVKARYINKETKEAFMLPIRQLLNLDVAESVAKSEEMTDDTAVAKVHEILIEKAGEDGTAELPAEIKVVKVEARTQKDGSRNVPMYPAYYYKEFNAEVKRRETEKDFDEANGQNAVSAVYQDFSFMGSLVKGTLEPRYADAEPLKTITICIPSVN